MKRVATEQFPDSIGKKFRIGLRPKVGDWLGMEDDACPRLTSQSILYIVRPEILADYSNLAFGGFNVTVGQAYAILCV